MSRYPGVWGPCDRVILVSGVPANKQWALWYALIRCGWVQYIEYQNDTCTATVRFATAEAAARAVSRLPLRGNLKKMVHVQYRSWRVTSHHVLMGAVSAGSQHRTGRRWVQVKGPGASEAHKEDPEAHLTPTVEPEDSSLHSPEELVPQIAILEPPSNIPEAVAEESNVDRQSRMPELPGKPAQVEPSTSCPTHRRGTSRVVAMRLRQRMLTRKCAQLAERSRAQESKLRKALKEKDLVAAAYNSVLQHVEAISGDLLVEAGEPSPSTSPQTSLSPAHWACALGGFRSRFETCATKLRAFVRHSLQAKEVLDRVLRCSVSLRIFRHPMLAPDGHAYEREMILPWLQRNPQSPLTKQPMRPEELLHDRVVQQATEALWLLRGQSPPPEAKEAMQDDCTKSEAHGNSGKEAAGIAAESVPPRSQLRLYDAIEIRDEVLAMELLQMPGEVEGLNDQYGEGKATVLHLALLKQLPSVAVAIIQHPDFHGHDCAMGGPRDMVQPFHIAASLGQHDVCEALLQCCGPYLTSFEVHRDVTLTLSPSGDELKLRRHHSPWEMAALNGHSSIVVLIDAATRAWLEDGD